VTDVTTTFGDPITQPFWEAATRRELLLQRCTDCGAAQFYPRPFCLACDSTALEWAPAAGGAAVYAATTVHLRVDPALEPPYVVAVVELDEGPRLTTNIVGGAAPIGTRVRLAWREREGAPPLPVFTPEDGAS
jgi:uncharacterized OB-fold protein